MHVPVDPRLAAIRHAVLTARDRRAALVRRHLGTAATITIGVNLPGPRKHPPAAAALAAAARRAIQSRLEGVDLVVVGADAAGFHELLTAPVAPDQAKALAVQVEHTLPGGRLVDVDVYGPDGRPLSRSESGLPPRACLVCEAPAHECTRVGRHDESSLSRAVDTQLTAAAASADRLCRLSPDHLAAALIAGARAELELTPKPGLVDHLDHGSHPDLTMALMRRSIDLLPDYFADLHAVADATVPADISGPAAWETIDLTPFVEAGRRAETRMLDAIGTNAHRGFIFLGGLTLLAARRARIGIADETAADPASLEVLRHHIGDIASRLLEGRTDPASDRSHGALVRRRHALGGIHREALAGLPSVFDHGLPHYLAASPAGSARAEAVAPRCHDCRTAHLLMAVLMQHVEDTTTVHRCGPAGLERLREDGARLERMIRQGEDYLPHLVTLNAEYRRRRLTMGGVADCMALTFALADCLI